MKICKKCQIPKDLKEFSKNGKYSACWCKSCVQKHGLVHRAVNALKRKETQLKSRYKLSLKEVESLYVLQEGKCTLCGTFKPSFSKLGGLVVDHDHSTGKVRSLLCTNCNVLLGRAFDNIELLQKAIDYLEWHKK